MNGPDATFDRAIDLLTEADPDLTPEDRVDAPTLAVKVLLDADRPLTKAEIADRIRRSTRTVTDVLGDLEAAGVVERHAQPRGSTTPDRFEVVET